MKITGEAVLAAIELLLVVGAITLGGMSMWPWAFLCLGMAIWMGQ